MPRATSFDRRLRYALLPALAAAAAGFAASWLLLVAPADTPPQPAALLRVRQGTGNHSEIATDEAVARLVSSESLSRALTQSGVLEPGISPAAAAEIAEKIRELVRVDIRVPDEAGVREVKIRWVGDPREKIAGRLVKALSRQLAASLAATDSPESRRQYETARSELAAAETALADIRARFEASLDAPLSRRREAVDPPVRALPNAAEADDSQLARQRLAELEQRRQQMADRLMPEHPEMRALDEKIEELRFSISRRPQVAAPRPLPVTTVPIEDRADEELGEKRIARSRQLWQAVLDAQNRYAAALAHERECRRTLATTHGQLVAEIESTSEVAQPIRRATWRRWVLSGLTGLLCGGLVLAVWPSRRQTFASAEEVRAVTRLPVVVVESASLN